MPLDLDVAQRLVAPIYEALSRPGEKDVETLIKSVSGLPMFGDHFPV